MDIKQLLLWIPIVLAIITLFFTVMKIIGFSYSIYSNMLKSLPTSCSYEKK